MSSLATSLGFCFPPKKVKLLNTICTATGAPSSAAAACLPIKNLERREPSSSAKLKTSSCTDTTVEFSIPGDGHPGSFALKRRQLGVLGAVGVFGVGLVQLDWRCWGQLKPAAAAAASCEFTVAPSGLAFCDQVLGTGPPAIQGQLIKAHYVGKLENGKVFDSSYSRGNPLSFRVGVGEVIKGWDQGILGDDGVPAMLAGGKRTLKIPPKLGYGVRGAGCRGGSCIIPPDSVLLFDVEFIG